MPWVALTLELDEAHAGGFTDALIEAGADSVVLEDADAGTATESPRYDGPAGEGTTAIAPCTWRRNRLMVLLAPEADARAVVAEAARRAGLARSPPYSVSRVEDEDWLRRSRDQFEPIEISARLWIVPSWREPPVAGAVVVRLDPGLAFGTGSHPTTRLVLRFLERALCEMQGGPSVTSSSPCVLDYGCGSGILAIAAAKLGAGLVNAVDLDPQALDATAANARSNGVEVRVATPRALAAGDYDVVVANILAHPLIELAPQLIARTRRLGRIALSGILESQVDDVIAAYAPEGALAIADTAEGWALLEGRRRPVTAAGAPR